MKLSLLFQVQGFFCIVHSKCLDQEECGKVWLDGLGSVWSCLMLCFLFVSLNQAFTRC